MKTWTKNNPNGQTPVWSRHWENPAPGKRNMDVKVWVTFSNTSASHINQYQSNKENEKKLQRLFARHHAVCRLCSKLDVHD